LPLHVFAWRRKHEEAGFAQHAVYLLRPDTYVALAEGSGGTSALACYFDQRRIKIAPSCNKGFQQPESLLAT
jgi:hypothetical protein